MSSTFAESLARGAVRDDDSFMGALARGYGLAGILDDMNRRSHEREVNGRIDEILAASNGGQTDLSTLDPKLYSDRVGMEAMGKVSEQLSQTGEYQNKIFANGIQQAKNLYGLAQGYMTDFKSAVDAGDSQRALAIYGNMANRMNIPYRFVPEGDGYHVYHVTPEGEQDMGNMSLTDLYKRTADALNNEQMFIKGSAAYSMTNWETNQKYMADPSKWKIGVTRDGKQLAMVPQTFMQDGQMVAGFYVQGLGNRTAQQLLDAGINVGGGTGLTATQAARATRGGGGRRGPGVSNGGQQDAQADGGNFVIPKDVAKRLQKLADENSKDKETGHDAAQVKFYHDMYAFALGVSRKAKGQKIISPDEFMAFMQQQRKQFEAENAEQLDGATTKQKNELFRNWFVRAINAGAGMLQGMKQGAPKTQKQQQEQNNPPASKKQPPRVPIADYADGTKKPPKPEAGVRLVNPEDLEDMPN